MNELAKDAVLALSCWVDDANAHRDPVACTWDRVSKITEELGEAAEAYLVWSGGTEQCTATLVDVVEETLDTALAALGAVEHMHGNHQPVAVDLMLERTDHPTWAADPDPPDLLARLTGANGQVTAAVIGLTGSNPRKGITHTRQDVVARLLDVAVIALVVVERLREPHWPAALDLLADKIVRVAERAGVLAGGARPGLPARQVELFARSWQPSTHDALARIAALDEHATEQAELLRRVRPTFAAATVYQAPSGPALTDLGTQVLEQWDVLHAGRA